MHTLSIDNKVDGAKTTTLSVEDMYYVIIRVTFSFEMILGRKVDSNKPKLVLFECHITKVMEAESFNDGWSKPNNGVWCWGGQFQNQYELNVEDFVVLVLAPFTLDEESQSLLLLYLEFYTNFNMLRKGLLAFMVLRWCCLFQS